MTQIWVGLGWVRNNTRLTLKKKIFLRNFFLDCHPHYYYSQQTFLRFHYFVFSLLSLSFIFTKKKLIGAFSKKSLVYFFEQQRTKFFVPAYHQGPVTWKNWKKKKWRIKNWNRLFSLLPNYHCSFLGGVINKNNPKKTRFLCDIFHCFVLFWFLWLSVWFAANLTIVLCRLAESGIRQKIFVHHHQKHHQSFFIEKRRIIFSPVHSTFWKRRNLLTNVSKL